MKKYIRNTAITLMTATALFSCDKFLEESPKDKLRKVKSTITSQFISEMPWPLFILISVVIATVRDCRERVGSL